MFLTRRIVPKTMSMLKPVPRQMASVLTRLVATCGVEAFKGVIQWSWAFSVAADASAHVHEVAYFSIRMRLVPIDEYKTSLHSVDLLAPPLS
jgi:hypothetical protein